MRRAQNSRIAPPTLVYQDKNVPKIGYGTFAPPDDRIYRPTYVFLYECIRPFRLRPEREVIEDLEKQLWRVHGRMRLEDWSIEPRFHTTALKLRVSVPPETVHRYRVPERGQRPSGDPEPTQDGPLRRAVDAPEAEEPGTPMSVDAAAPSRIQAIDTFDDVGIARFRASLPASARGPSADAVKQRRLFLVAQVKQLTAAGDKVVLSSRIEGDEVIVEYMLEEGGGGIVEEADPGPAGATTGCPPPVAVDLHAMQDVKPVILPNENPTESTAATAPNAVVAGMTEPSTETAMLVDADGDADEDVDELATPPPAPDAPRFPLPGLSESRADSVETYGAVTSFLAE